MSSILFLHNTLQIVTITQTKNMSEVRVHAAFSVDNEETFLRDVQPMISATQVRKHTHPCQTYITYYFLFRVRRVVFTMHCTRRVVPARAMP